ncbi:hypothetical protein [Streptacidiphilus sp. P02-A3a]|uniref:hypothetical protein n=1 Tax=Streptacidiphilus sp. P02-A3a TaxID=2704468 RepID=UPI0015FCD8BF|nr:hypothetical protein [Streptacidiphilus sp. P02-A3a]QMU73096.1 hypothetical protein GXP74_37525 [Streptacidiphilus sp. P02-A3a]
MHDDLDSTSALALACSTALRLGGALYVLAERAGLAEPYYLADAGLRAGLRAAAGRTLNQGLLQQARSGLSVVRGSYSMGHAIAFTQAGFAVIGRVLQALEQPDEQYGLPEVLALAGDAAVLWPDMVDPEIDPGGSLVTYERASQIDARRALEAGGVSELRQVLGAQELTYRRLAKSLA